MTCLRTDVKFQNTSKSSRPIKNDLLGINTKNPGWSLLFPCSASLAQMEPELLVERTRARLAAA